MTNSSIFNYGGSSFGNQTLWGYQDFAAGVITGTSVTLTANENGSGATLANFYNYAAIYKADGTDYVYKASFFGLFTGLVSVSSQSGTTITLNRIPDSATNVRIWWVYHGVYPAGYILPPQNILNAASAIKLDDLFVADTDIGVTVQPFDATLTSIALLGTAADKMIYTTGVDTWAETALTSFSRTLLDDANQATAQTTLGIGTGDSPTFTGLTLSSMTEGSVLFAGASGVVSQDNSSLFYNDTLNRLGIGVNTFLSTNAGLHIVGDVEIEHTATETDDHALEIDVDAAGFGDVKALDITYKTGTIALGQDEAIMLVSIDEFAATGGDVAALEVLTTSGSATVYGMLAGAVVNPILQLSGVFANADSILVKAVDQLTALSSGGAGNISIFVADNDTITIGHAAKFEELEFILDTLASGAGIAPTFEYSTGDGTWATFTPVDGTNGLRQSGVVAWLVGDIPSWLVGTGAEFLIRVTRTRNNLSTTPIADLIQITAVVEYSWNKDGDLLVNKLGTGAAPVEVLDISVGNILAEGVHGAGDTISASGAGTRLMWYPQKSAFRAGAVVGTEWDNANIGVYSSSFGQANKSSGDSSFSAGSQCVASGDFSVALGLESTASGTSSTAFGGSNVTASNNYAFAGGRATKASGDTSTALGRDIIVSGTNSFGIGLAVNSDTLAQANSMAIMGGNVGIDDLTPSERLSVTGNVAVSGTIASNDLDSATATTLLLGKSTATKLELADTGVITEVQGNLDVLEGLDVTGNTTISGDLAINGTDITSTGELDFTPASGSAFKINLATTGDFIVNTNDLVVDTSAGFVGIGETAPAALLHLTDASSLHMGVVLENNDCAAGIELETQTATATGEGILNIGINTERAIPVLSGDPTAAWFRIDTRAGTDIFTWYHEASGSSVENQLMTLNFSGDLGLGAAVKPSANGGKVMYFGDNTADPTMSNNTAGIYGKNVTTTVEMFAVDEAGNATQLSPHDPETGKWYYDSTNTKTGRRVTVDMEGFLKHYDLANNTSFFQESCPLVFEDVS